MRDIGKHFSVNAMIKKESVQQRLVREDQGISYTEFSYSLLQGYDFAELYKRHRLHAAGRRLRPVGQHRRRHRPDPPHAPPSGLRHDRAADHQGRRHQVRQDRIRRRLARPEEDLAVRLLPVLAEHRGRRRLQVPQVLHLPAARPHRRDRSHRQGQRQQAGSPAHPGRGSHPPGARRSRPDGRPPHYRSPVLRPTGRPDRNRPRTTGPGRHARRASSTPPTAA